ncbi:hypothetical protein PS838_00964 [Pseudomonas fluorescens]|nr:hypothetical protein PS838_00964 [Pseudomonas fluorescens]
MANYSLAELTDRMQGKSITLGWDAVVFMNRAKVNSLLEQQYITRFNKDSFLKRISGAAPVIPGGKEYLQLNGLILSHPRLSFAKASLRNSQVIATMDIVAGSVSYVRKSTNQVPGGVLNSFEVSAHQGFTVTMYIDLVAGQGTVNEQGEVIIDIGDAYDCQCNLIDDAESQLMLGDFFKDLFLRQTPEDRVYTLGKLDLRDVDLLAPRSFIIRTMATDEGKLRTSDDYGDGAVVLLVRTRGNPEAGEEPTEASLDYLIPNDRDAQGKAMYSGALVLASRVVFDWYIQEHMQKAFNSEIRFTRENESKHVARKLYAETGSEAMAGYYNRYHQTIESYIEVGSYGPLAFYYGGNRVENSLRVFSSTSNGLTVELSGEQELPFRYKQWIWLIKDEVLYADLPLAPNIKFEFDPVVEVGTNLVRFENRPNYSCFINSERLRFDDRLPSEVTEEIYDTYVAECERIAKLIENSAVKNSFDIPQINTLAISNLLFPEHNALQLTEARLPGDLALFGQIDPKETTFTLDPLMPVVKTGEKQQFTIRQLGVSTADVTWSVRSVDGTRATGTIVEGEFTAPEALLLEGTAARNVVTATYTDPGTGKEVTASALVTVVLSGIVVTPSMSLVDMSDKRSLTLKATSLGDGPFKWTPLEGTGTLIPNGNEATYTPPETDLPDGALQAVLFEVEDIGTGAKTIATVLLRQGNFAMDISPAFIPGLRAQGFAQLTASGAVPPDQLKWEVVAGQGTIDPASGIFTAPTVITSPYSVVKVTHESEWVDTVGYSIIYLTEHAKQSTWLDTQLFEFEVHPSTVWANGLQQARVVVRCQPAQIKDGPVAELSEAEFASIELVSADQKLSLPPVGNTGVPEGGKWHVTETNHGYTPYPELVAATPDNNNDPKVYVKEFFVSCHSVENLMISAHIVSDNYKSFYSNKSAEDDEASRKVKRLVAVKPPSGGTVGGVRFMFGEKPFRVKGRANEVDLETIDYYYLKLVIKGDQVAIKTVKFVGKDSMVQWESNTSLEDVHSVTGYALPAKNSAGQQVLCVDDILLRRMHGTLPSLIVDDKYPVPANEIMISLHRRQYWRYDQYVNTDFKKTLEIIVFDEFGNKHNVGIAFDGTDRNVLRILGS